jgi:hypothetical protein
MDKMVHFNRPDITLILKINEDAAFIDTAIPLTHILQATNAEKQYKYQELAI